MLASMAEGYNISAKGLAPVHDIPVILTEILWFVRTYSESQPQSPTVDHHILHSNDNPPYRSCFIFPLYPNYISIEWLSESPFIWLNVFKWLWLGDFHPSAHPRRLSDSSKATCLFETIQDLADTTGRRQSPKPCGLEHCACLHIICRGRQMYLFRKNVPI